MKEIFNVWFKRGIMILAIGIAILITAVGIFRVTAAGIYLASIAIKKAEPPQIRTDIEPIYNHFPDLPETSEIQWCSKSSDGVGLTTTHIYIFAFYDYDISKELQDLEITDESMEHELYFIPNGIDENQEWKHTEDAVFAFQKDIEDTQKMYTDVYINEARTILYIEAVGD